MLHTHMVSYVRRKEENICENFHKLYMLIVFILAKCYKELTYAHFYFFSFIVMDPGFEYWVTPVLKVRSLFTEALLNT